MSICVIQSIDNNAQDKAIFLIYFLISKVISNRIGKREEEIDFFT